MPVIADQPGSVYVFAPLGLLHYTAADPAHPTYALKTTYVPQLQEQPLWRFDDQPRVLYSPLGFFVTTQRPEVTNGNQHAKLILIPRP
jgi:hypothetical protein